MPNMIPLAPPIADTRQAQAKRVAAYLKAHPNATGKEIDAACDTGSITKVISEMKRLGYGIGKSQRRVPCVNGRRSRLVAQYRLLYCPSAAPSLFD